MMQLYHFLDRKAGSRNLPGNENARLIILKQTHIMNSIREDVEFDRFTSLLKRIIKVNSCSCLAPLNVRCLIPVLDSLCIFEFHWSRDTVGKIKYWNSFKKSFNSTWEINWRPINVSRNTWNQSDFWYGFEDKISKFEKYL